MIDIIIPTFNNLEITKKCIEELYKYTTDFRLICVDNGSTDGTVTFLQELKKEKNNVSIILLEKNYGFGAAVNKGLEITENDVVLMNNDVFVTPGWLENLIKTAYSDSKIGVCSAKLIFPSGRLCAIGNYIHIPNTKLYDEKYNIHFIPIGKGDAPDYHNTDRLVDTLFFSLVLIKKEILDMGVRFDENIFIDNDDTDFCLQVREKNYFCAFSANSIAYHLEGASKGLIDISIKSKESLFYVIDKWKDEAQHIIVHDKKYMRPELCLSQLYSLKTDMSGHVYRLYDLVTKNNIRSVIDLGVRQGISTISFLCGVYKTGGLVIGVDIANCDGAIEYIKYLNLHGLFFFVKDDSINFLRRIRYAVDTKLIKPGLIMIDTNHEYEHTIKELELSDRLKPKFIVLHDTNEPSFPGVRRALDEFLKQNKEKYNVKEYDDYHGLTVLER
ncbi:MAG: glycosyltransferase [Bacillota bacterium]